MFGKVQGFFRKFRNKILGKFLYDRNKMFGKFSRGVFIYPGPIQTFAAMIHSLFLNPNLKQHITN